MDWGGRCLDDVTVLPADGGMQFYEQVFVGKFVNVNSSKVQSEVFSNFFCQIL